MQKMWYKTKEKGFIKGISSLKGIAAFLIFIFHFWGFYKAEILNIIGESAFFVPFQAGFLGLDLFFIFSGFLLFLSIAKEGRVSKQFFIRRLKRLYPLAFFITILFFLLKGPDYWQTTLGIKNLFYHLFFIQSLSIDTYWGLNPVMWFLTVEVLFIVLLPLLLSLFKTKKSFIFAILLLMFANFFYRIWVFQYFDHWDTYERIFYSEQLWGRFDQLALGTLFGVFWISPARKKIGQLVSNTALFTGFFNFLIILWIFAYLGSEFRESLFLQTFLHFFASLFFVFFLFGYLTNKNKLVKEFFAPDLFAGLGVISYSFFLWHFPVISFVYKTGVIVYGAFFISLVLSIFLSIFSYYFIERFFYFKEKEGA